MTVDALYRMGLEILKSSGTDDFRFDCDRLFESAVGLSKTGRVLNSENEISDNDTKAFLELVSRRVSGEPLQYILGKWEFMGIDFLVGEGVLIPRPETELIVENALDFIRERKNAVVFDLCAGSGAIGLSIAKLCPHTQVFLFEKFDAAFDYLKKNNEISGLKNTVLVKYDITDGFDKLFVHPDLIVSNPPYIASEEIASLQKEVRYEPRSALDGGDDGLDFYRCIAGKWLGAVKPGGQVILECGDRQSADVIKIFSPYIRKSEVLFDFNDIDRAVRLYV